MKPLYLVGQNLIDNKKTIGKEEEIKPVLEYLL